MSNEVRRLYKSRDNRVFSGVAGGLAEFFGIDPTIVRLLFVFTSFGALSGFFVYLIMMIIVPEEPLGNDIQPAEES